MLIPPLSNTSSVCQKGNIFHLLSVHVTAPSGPARGVVGSPRSASSIILQWQEPDVQHWNGDLLGYMMRYKLSGYPDETMTFYNISRKEVNMHELDGLIVFQVSGCTEAMYKLFKP